MHIFSDFHKLFEVSAYITNYFGQQILTEQEVAEYSVSLDSVSLYILQSRIQ